MAYSAEQADLGMQRMVQEGIFSRIMDGLTGGVILAGFALALGATDLQIGALTAIPFLAQLAHLPALALLRRFPDRRPLVAWLAGASRLLFFVVAALPFVEGPFDRVDALVAVMLAYATLATLAGAGWQVWVREMVPRERLGAYFGKRMAILAAVGLVTLLVAGEVVALWSRFVPHAPLAGFAVLFVVGGACGLASALVLGRAPSVVASGPAPLPLRDALRKPFADREYRCVLVFLGAWGFAANLAVPFVSVVLLRTLGYSVALVTGLAALSLLANVAGLRLWAPFTDRFGNKPVLGLSASVFLVTILAWALVPKVPGPLVLGAAFAVHVLLGFANAGLDVASTGLTMKMAPDDDIPAYLSSASLVKALLSGVAPILGGILVTALGARRLSLQLAWSAPGGETVFTPLAFAGHDFLFLASVVLGLYALHRLLGFREEGEAPPEQVMRAMRRDVASPTSVAGMRAFAHVASYVVEASYRFTR